MPRHPLHLPTRADHRGVRHHALRLPAGAALPKWVGRRRHLGRRWGWCAAWPQRTAAVAGTAGRNLL